MRILFCVILILSCWYLGYSRPTSTSKSPDSSIQQKPDEQLEINKNALLEGKDETIRIGAAFLILSDSSPAARQFLIDTLKSDKNKPARITICKAISRFRTQKSEIPNKQVLIGPLTSIISTSEDTSEMRQAAEALMIFGYNEISPQIEKLASDSSVAIKARLNAVYVLQIQPDMRATIMLIRLIDDPDKKVSAEAEKALQSIGIPLAQDRSTRNEMIKELEGKGKDKFLQDWLIRQEIEHKKLEDKVITWRDKYLAALDKLYGQVTDDAEKGKFLSAYLADSEPQVRLWAVDKVNKWWVGTGAKLTIWADVKEALTKLIPDTDRDVRLKTAQLLSLIGESGWTTPLVEQYKKEQDAEVKLAFFDALGWSAYYSSLPNATVKVSPEQRREILLWAEQYIQDSDSKKVIKGIDCFKKLLEQDGLDVQEVEFYFTFLRDNFNDKADNEAIGSQILSAMAKLTASSVYKDKAIPIFRPLFEQAVKNPSDSIRLSAVEGLINIDKVSALKLLRADFTSDKNPVIREKIIELADAVGTKDDLNWLAEKLASASENKPAWQAMLKIFKRSDSAVVYEWIGKLDSRNADDRLSSEQMLLLLETAEAKVTQEKNTKILTDIQFRLSKTYSANGNFERAAKYIGNLLQSETTEAGKDARCAELLIVYLKWPNMELASQLLANKLLEKDLGEDSPLTVSIDNFLSSMPNGSDPNSVLGPLRKIQATDKPKWNAQLQKWSQAPKPSSTEN